MFILYLTLALEKLSQITAMGAYWLVGGGSHESLQWLVHEHWYTSSSGPKTIAWFAYPVRTPPSLRLGNQKTAANRCVIGRLDEGGKHTGAPLRQSVWRRGCSLTLSLTLSMLMGYEAHCNALRMITVATKNYAALVVLIPFTLLIVLRHNTGRLATRLPALLPVWLCVCFAACLLFTDE